MAPSLSHSGVKFLDLPPELRNMVYEAIVAAPSPLLVLPIRHRRYEAVDGDQPLDWKAFVITLSLFRVSNQLRREAREVALQKNTFRFRSEFWLHAFLSSLGEAGRKELRSLNCNWGLQVSILWDERIVSSFLSDTNERRKYMSEVCRMLSHLTVEIAASNRCYIRSYGHSFFYSNRQPFEVSWTSCRTSEQRTAARLNSEGSHADILQPTLEAQQTNDESKACALQAVEDKSAEQKLQILPMTFCPTCDAPFWYRGLF